MSHDLPAPPPLPDRRIALLIDADNVAHSHVETIIAELSRRGTAHIRRAYGDWASLGEGWRDKLHGFAIRPIQQISYTAGKNATDIALVIDAMELLYTQKPDAYGIASSDADFTPLVMQLKAHGHDVFGFGERKTPEPFVNACTTFLYLDGEPPARGKPAAPKAAKPKAKLAQDTRLVKILRAAVDSVKRENGWALLATAGGHAKRQAGIEPRNYGARNFPALFKAVGLFEIAKAENGQSYVADKRHKGRTPQPQG